MLEQLERKRQELRPGDGSIRRLASFREEGEAVGAGAVRC